MTKYAPAGYFGEGGFHAAGVAANGSMAIMPGHGTSHWGGMGARTTVLTFIPLARWQGGGGGEEEDSSHECELTMD